MAKPAIAYIYYSNFTGNPAHGFQLVNMVNALNRAGYATTLYAHKDIRTFLRDNDLRVDGQVSSPAISLPHEIIDKLNYYTFATRKARNADVIYTRDVSYLRYLRMVPFDPPPVLYEAHKCYSGMGELSKEDEVSRLANAGRIITQSAVVKSDLESLGIDVEQAIPNAANDMYVPNEYPQWLADELGITEESTTIIYVGSLYEWKHDFETVFKAIDNLESPDYKLLIVGGTSDEVKWLRRLATQTLANPQHVEFIGHVPHEQVFEYLAVADIGLVPLRDDNPESTKYTSPIKLFEYLVSGLNVIASDVPSVQAIDVDSLHYYTPFDVQSCTAALEAARNAPGPSETYRFTYDYRAEQVGPILDGLVE